MTRRAPISWTRRAASGPSRLPATRRSGLRPLIGSSARSMAAGRRRERVGVEMVGVIVGRGDDIYEVEAFGGDDAGGHADVGFVGGGVFARQGVGKVRVEEQVPALPLEKVAALAEPPEVESAALL